MNVMNNDVVIIKLDRERQLKFTHKALKSISAELGKSIEEIDDEVIPTNFELIEVMLHAGLQFDAKEKNETLEKSHIEDLLEYAPSVAYTFEKIFEAWKVAWGATEGNQTAPAELEQSTTGTKASD
jgi:hypothetical protein